MAMGPRPYRRVCQPGLWPDRSIARLGRCRCAELGWLRYDQPRLDHDPRRRASLPAALRRRASHHHRSCRARRSADDRGPRTIGQSAVAAFRRFVAALAQFRLPDPGARDSSRHTHIGTREMTDLPVTIADIRQAATAMSEAVAQTPLIRAASLCELTGVEVFLKLETLHPTGSVKERGALNQLRHLWAAERRPG